MDAERWTEVRTLFGRCIDLSEEERAAFLDENVADPELRAEVEDLLRAESEAPSSFVRPPDDPVPVGRVFGPTTGDRLGDFELREEIGSGGMGVVFRATQDALGRDVAIKVVGRGLLTRSRGLERFRREVRAAGRLDHPAIAKILVDGVEENVAWYAMELVPGHSLAEEIRRHRFPDAKAPPTLPAYGTLEHVRAVARFVAAVADGLHHAHEHGVVHRDVKPSNLLITPDRAPKLVDFGVAKDTSFGTITESDQVIGSLPYMSPEQARLVRRQVDERTDVYSLGAVLYELLSLRRPFAGGTTHEMLMRIRSTEPRPVRKVNDRVPRDLAVICQTAMAKEVGERYRSAGSMASDLRKYLLDEDIEAQSPSLPVRARRFVRHHRIGALVAAVTAVMLLSGWMLRRSVEPELPHATLRIEGPAGSEVSLRRLDPITAVPGPAERLGTLPLGAHDLAAGFVRIVVDRDGAPLRSSTRRVRDDVETRVVLGPVEWGADPFEGMRRIEGGPMTVEDPWFSPLAERTIEIEPFWLDEAEVSVAEYGRYLAANPDIEVPPGMSLLLDDESLQDRPMVYVSWAEARAYAEWVGKRLPTSAEWVWAARGKENRRFPWGDGGDDLGVVHAPQRTLVTPEDYLGALRDFVAPTRSHDDARTPERLYHMFGNVEEWTESPVADVQSEQPGPLYDYRCIRGGRWDSRSPDLDPALRRDLASAIGQSGAEPMAREWYIGFRCARSER